MAGGVAGRFDDRDASRAPNCTASPSATVSVDAGDLCRFRLRADDLQPKSLLQGEVGLDMVAMVMRDQDQRRPPAGALDRASRIGFSSGASISAVSPLFGRRGRARRNCRCGI